MWYGTIKKLLGIIKGIGIVGYEDKMANMLKEMMELQVIQSKIYEIRGQKVMLDFDLAEIYQVETRVLNQSVKRNIQRFPEDFMFQGMD